MTITHVIFSFNTGGAELLVSDIMAEQIKAGHRVNLLVINNLYEESLLKKLHPEINVILVNRPEGSRNPWWILRYNMLLRRTRPDVVHFHQNNSAYITIKWKKVIFVQTIHDTGIDLKLNQKKNDIVFAISKAVRDDLYKRLFLESTIVENGIPCQEVAKKDYKGIKYTHDCGKIFRIVLVGRLNYKKKGQDLAIEALSQVVKKGINATLDLIGDGDSQDYLRQLAEKNGVSKRVKFLGNCTRNYIYSSLQYYDLFLLPSRYEGFGLVVAEAMAAKLPVVVSDIEGPLEIIGSGAYGTAFRCGDVHSLTQTILDIEADYPKYALLAWSDAYEHVCRKYNVSRTAAEYLANYEKILGR